MDLRNALELIQSTAQQAQSKEVVTLGRGNPHVARELMPDGVTINEVIDVFPTRNHTVFDLDSLATWTTRDNSEETGEPKPHVWHAEDAVIVVLDDSGYRENLVTMPLPKHPKFAALATKTGATFDQKGLIDFLRLNLKEEIEAAAPGFIASLRKVRFDLSDRGQNEVQVGRESMGREINAIVTGVDAFPEDLVLEVPMWQHLDCVVKVDIWFDVDTSDRKFTCRPKPGAIEAAKNAAQAWLHGQLVAQCDGCPVFFGQP